MQFLEKMGENIEILTCNNRKEEKLFSIRTKLSYCKIFHIKFIGNRNQKNANIYEQACLFRFINIRSR